MCPAPHPVRISVDEDGKIVANQGYTSGQPICGTDSTNPMATTWPGVSGNWFHPEFLERLLIRPTAGTQAGAFAYGNRRVHCHRAQLKGTATYNGVATRSCIRRAAWSSTSTRTPA